MTMFKVDREELAWAAGFFDGEGCFHCSGQSRTLQPRVSIGQVDRGSLDRFQRAVQVGKVYGPKKHAGRNEKIGYHQYQVGSFEGVQHILAVLWPFLGPIKKEQGSRVIARYLARRRGE